MIVLAAVVLAWGAAALTTGSADFGLVGPGSGGGVSPSCLPTTIERTAALPGTSLDVSPAPETVSASPHTQISLLGVPAGRIGAVSVVGAQTGAHPGRLLAYSQGDGASFVPDAPFASGERVTVRVALSAGTGTGTGTAMDAGTVPGTVSGAGAPPGPGARQLAFGFRVDTPYSTANTTDFANLPAPASDYQSFYTVPGMRAPIMTVTAPDRDPTAGDIFTTNGPGPGQYGPLIYTPQGRLVWFDQMPEGEAAENLSVQTYEGRRDLTFWRGHVLSLGFGQGEDVVMDSRYRAVARIHGANGLSADLHDFQIATDGVAYITAYNPIRCDLTAVKGSASGALVDTAIQEIDMRTGLVRWEWHSLDHVGVGESEVEVPHGSMPWDYFHLNSIDPQPGGDIFISARSTWAGYQLQGKSGAILWRLGGNRSSFQMEPGTKLAWQHDGRVLSGGQVTFFDDGSNPPIHSQSRAVRIALDFRTRRARLLAAVTHDPPLLAPSQGNVQTLAGGDTLVGWGGVPAITEYAPDGTTLFDAHQPLDMSFYRAFRFPWSARPLDPPRVSAGLNDTGEETIAHMSWNGATGVAAWRLLAGQRSDALSVLATIPDSDFESSTTLPAKYAYVAAQALDAHGRVLAVSGATAVIPFYASLSDAG